MLKIKPFRAVFIRGDCQNKMIWWCGPGEVVSLVIWQFHDLQQDCQGRSTTFAESILCCNSGSSSEKRPCARDLQSLLGSCICTKALHCSLVSTSDGSVAAQYKSKVHIQLLSECVWCCLDVSRRVGQVWEHPQEKRKLVIHSHASRHVLHLLLSLQLSS